MTFLWSIALSVLTVVLYGLAFPPFDYPALGLIAFVPWTIFVGTRPLQRPLLMSLLSGCALWMMLLFWLHKVTTVGWMGLSAALGLFAAAWLFLCARLLPAISALGWMKRLGGLIYLASIWVMLEYIRGVLFGGFPWLPLIASQTTRPLMLGLLPYGGASLGSFALIFFNLSLGMSLIRLSQPLWAGNKKTQLVPLRLGAFNRCPELLLSFGLLVVGWMLALKNWKAHEREPEYSLGTVAFIQPRTPATLKWDPAHAREQLHALKKLTLEASEQGATLAFWPEAATPMPALGKNSLQRWIEDLSQQARIPILMGNTAFLEDKWYNALMWVDPARGIDTEFYAKHCLVPFGEYIPFRKYIPESLQGFLHAVVPVPIDTTPGGDAQELLIVEWEGHNLKLGGLVCYEDIFPDLTRKATLAGAQILVVVTNDSWGHSDGMALQHAAHSVLRAVECARPVMRVGNNGWSGWIDALGRRLFSMRDACGNVDFQGVDYYSPTIPYSAPITPYTRFGEWAVALCTGVAALGSIRLLLRRVFAKKKAS